MHTFEGYSVPKLEAVYQVLVPSLKRERREKAFYILTTSSNKSRDNDDRLGLRIQRLILRLILLCQSQEVIRTCTMT